MLKKTQTITHLKMSIHCLKVLIYSLNRAVVSRPKVLHFEIKYEILKALLKHFILLICTLA